MLNYKKIRSKYFLLSLITLILVPSTALANHQTSSTYGDRPIYGHFGQPHGYVVSGDFTYIVSTHGKVDRVTFKIVKEGDINNILGTYTQTSITPGTNGDNYYNLVWNSTPFKDGNYQLFADVENDTVTPNGWRDFVVHYDGKNHLKFKVENPKVIIPPVTAPPDDKCTNRLDKAKQLALKVYTKQNNNMKFIDNFLQQTTLFSRKSAPTLNLDGELTKVSEARKQASDNVVTLNKTGDFNCDGDLKEQVKNYLTQSEKTRSSLDTYKDSVISYMLKVLGAL